MKGYELSVTGMYHGEADEKELKKLCDRVHELLRVKGNVLVRVELVEMGARALLRRIRALDKRVVEEAAAGEPVEFLGDTADVFKAAVEARKLSDGTVADDGDGELN